MELCVVAGSISACRHSGLGSSAASQFLEVRFTASRLPTRLHVQRLRAGRRPAAVQRHRSCASQRRREEDAVQAGWKMVRSGR